LSRLSISEMVGARKGLEAERFPNRSVDLSYCRAYMEFQK
jgi:hypothetical protein